jgi:hypothetical protein
MSSDSESLQFDVVVTSDGRQVSEAPAAVGDKQTASWLTNVCFWFPSVESSPWKPLCDGDVVSGDETVDCAVNGLSLSSTSLLPGAESASDLELDRRGLDPEITSDRAPLTPDVGLAGVVDEVKERGVPGCPAVALRGEDQLPFPAVTDHDLPVYDPGGDTVRPLTL